MKNVFKTSIFAIAIFFGLFASKSEAMLYNPFSTTNVSAIHESMPVSKLSVWSMRYKYAFGNDLKISLSKHVSNSNFIFDANSFNTENLFYKPHFNIIACDIPSTQASAVSTVCIGRNSMNLKFTRGNGSRVIVLARAGSAVNSNPVDNVSYTANSTFGLGSEIGTGNFVVYDGNDSGIVIVPITGLSQGVTYYFSVYEYNETPICYNTTPATANGTTRAEGIYISSTTTQNTADVIQGTLAADIVKLTVVIGGGEDLAATINSITFTTNGSTNPTTDISRIKIFYTGNVDAFSNKTQFGQTFTTVGTNTAVGNFALKAGNNYFWIAYDVKTSATPGDILDATVTSINITDGSGTANYIPTVTAPPGGRLIVAPPNLVYCSGVIPEACCIGTYCNFSCCQGETLTSISLSGAVIQSFAGWPCNGTPGNDKNSYTDMFNSNIYQLNQGATSTMSINFDTWFSVEMQWAIWVDWNQDGVFTNGSPERFPSTGSIDQWTSQTITVPASVSSGRHRARLWIQEFSYPPTEPCRTSHGPFTTSIGYIVDFNIVVPDGSLPNLDPGVSSEVPCLTTTPGVTTPIYYTLGDTPSQLTATGTSLLWYDSPTGGVGSVVAPTPTTDVTGTQFYYVSQTSGGCEGHRIQIAVNVIPPNPPSTPLTTVTQPTCDIATGTINFNNLPSSGSWTIIPSNVTSSGSTYTLSPINPGSYDFYVADSIGCLSSSSVNVVVNSQPPTPSTPIVATVVQPTTTEPTGSITLSGLPADGWVINPGGYVGNPGETSITITGLAEGSYTFTVTNADGCESAPTDVILLDQNLPIELLTFKASCNADAVLIEWSTASETNNNYFTLEKSNDGNIWAYVATIIGAGNSISIKNYFFNDIATSDATTYYRLSQTDFDGSKTVFDAISVSKCKEDVFEFYIVPNPTDGFVDVHFSGNKEQFSSIEIFDVLGNKVYYSDIFSSTIDLSILPNGLYSLSFKYGNRILVKKFVILK